MRKFTLNIFTLSLGLAVMPMVEAAPVSYTHLDVYKRQGEYRSDALAAEEILTLANWCLLNYSGLKTPVGSAS